MNTVWCRTRKGLVVMDSPGREPELLTGLAAAGCNLIVFTTGRGAPQGFPLVPVIKVTGNAHTFERDDRPHGFVRRGRHRRRAKV